MRPRLIFFSIFVAVVQTGAPVRAADPQADLLRAVYKGDATAVKKAIKAGGNPKAADQFGVTLLHNAMLGRTSSLAVVKALVEAGADVNAKNQWGSTPLHSAWKTGIAAYLIEKGAVVDAKDNNGITPLAQMVEQGKDGISASEVLIKAGANVESPAILLEAAMRLETSVVDLLLRKGANPNGADEFGRTALHLVARQDQDIPAVGKIMDLLIQKGADPKAKDKKGFTPYSYSFWSGDFSGHLNRTALKKFLELGADITEVQSPGYTPVLSIGVIRKDDVEFLKYLGSKGFDVKGAGVGTISGTVLHIAAYFFLPKVAAYVLELGADVNARGFENMTPLHSALDSCGNNADTRIAAMILAKGADLEAIRSDGRTALHMAATYGNPGWTSFLLKYKPNLNARTAVGQTPMIIASIIGSAPVVDLLIAAGADVSAIDNFGNTPYYYAQQFKHAAIMASLKKAGAAEQTVDGAMKKNEPGN